MHARAVPARVQGIILLMNGKTSSSETEGTPGQLNFLNIQAPDAPAGLQAREHWGMIPLPVGGGGAADRHTTLTHTHTKQAQRQCTVPDTQTRACSV